MSIRNWLSQLTTVTPRDDSQEEILTFRAPRGDVEAVALRHFDQAMNDAIAEIATNMVNEFFYETEEGAAKLHEFKSILDRYPAISDAQFNAALSEAVMKVFTK